MKILLAEILSLLVLVGCATQPIATSEAKEVPNSRILASRFTAKKEGAGVVIVKRDTGFMGALCSSRVFVDGTPVADIRVGEKVTLYLSPGEYIISSNPNGVCGGGLAEIRVNFSESETSTLRIRYGTSGDYTIQSTAF